jgi:hypothetical protein
VPTLRMAADHGEFAFRSPHQPNGETAEDIIVKRLFEKSWQLLGECVGCAPNFGDRNEDIRDGFDRGAMGIGGFDNPGRETWGSSP